jgi:hypothetical protein
MILMTSDVRPVYPTAQEAASFLGEAAASPQLADQAAAAFTRRWEKAEDPRQLRRYLVHAPQLPDSKAQEVYEEVLAWERFFIAPHLTSGDTIPGFLYGAGTAAFPDQLAIVGSGPVLMEAQHATDPVRKATGKRELADHGTAGLAASIASLGLGRAVIPRGLQTGNGNVGESHPIKDELVCQSAQAPYAGFLSVHGMVPSRVIHPLDDEEVHAVIGLGLQPREVSFGMAETLIARAADELGLRLVIGNTTPQLTYQKDPDYTGLAFRDKVNRLVIGEDGLPATSKLAAAGAATTTTFMHDVLPVSPVSQLEISRSLRLTPHDRDRSARIMGVYLGRELVRLAAEVTARAGTSCARM